MIVAPAIGLAALAVAPALTANAGGGYSYDHAVDCSSTFGTYSWCIDENGNGAARDAGEQWSPAGFNYRNCTDYIANKIRTSGMPSFANDLNGGRFGHAGNWDDNARALGWTVSTAPRASAVAVSNAGAYGHVAWVESVNADGSVNISEYNFAGRGEYGTRYNVRFDSYIYVPGVTQTSTPPASGVAQYANSIVKWSGDSVTAWYVSPDLKRMWIPDTASFNQLKARGVPGPHVLPASVLDQLPDQRNQWVATGSTWTGNRALRRGMEVRSADGRYRFVMQNDGNLVLYGPTGRALWATSFISGAWRSQEYVIFQSDGNLVTYGGGRALWWSGTSGSGARFVLQNDGNLVIYTTANRAVWSSGTSGRT